MLDGCAICWPGFDIIWVRALFDTGGALAGDTGGEDVEGGACGCASAGAAAPALWLLGLLALARRRP